MTATLTPAPINRHNPAMPAATDPRALLLQAAADLLGGQRALATALGVSERSVRAWLAGDRSISDGVLGDTMKALGTHGDRCHALAFEFTRHYTPF